MEQSKYAQHQDLLKRIILAAQKRFPNIRLFPAQVGSFYVKRFISKVQYTFNGPYKIGTIGQADLNGVININGVGIRVEIEVKSGKSLIKKGSKQDVWRRFCRANGIIYIEATSVNQMVLELESQISEKTKLIKGEGRGELKRS